MKVAASITFVCLALAVSTAPRISAADDGRSITSVNKSVHAEAGATYDTLSTVNGDVRIGRGATADSAKTVNGEIVLEEDVRVGNASTVNGSLKIGSGAAVAHEVSTVNGELSLAKRAQVGGDASTVNGDIELDGADITGKLSTVSGDIDLKEGARVRGGIHVRKPNSGWNWNKLDIVKVHVCATCVVEGDLRFDRPVELRVETGAKIGNVIGDEVTRR